MLGVGGVFKVSAKEGKKLKIAMATLVREVLKESSFINRTANIEKSGESSNMANSQGKIEVSNASAFQVPNIVVEGRKRESIKLNK